MKNFNNPLAEKPIKIESFTMDVSNAITISILDQDRLGEGNSIYEIGDKSFDRICFLFSIL
jgi:hypothetical protein